MSNDEQHRRSIDHVWRNPFEKSDPTPRDREMARILQEASSGTVVFVGGDANAPDAPLVSKPRHRGASRIRRWWRGQA